LGGGFHRFEYGFRKFPHSSRVTLVGGFAFGARQPTVSLQLEQREVKHNLHVELGAELTGLNIIRFHGFGNETPLPAISSRVNQKQSRLTLGFAFEPSSHVRFTVGGIAKVAVTDRDDPTFLRSLGATFYGTGTFGQIGVQGGVQLDFRDRPMASTKGVVFRMGGSVYGPWIDVTQKTFGEVHGEVSAYATAWATLALRAAAKKVFGAFPFQEAAYLGGNSTLRGFAEQRFAGDASLLGSAELRVPVTKVRIIFPGHFGIHGLVDVGRVFSDLDNPGDNTLHSAFGGGFWISVLDPANVLSVSIAASDERTGVYVRTGFHF
jgi:outer membrane protein assembly factor BamA